MSGGMNRPVSYVSGHKAAEGNRPQLRLRALWLSLCFGDGTNSTWLLEIEIGGGLLLRGRIIVMGTIRLATLNSMIATECVIGQPVGCY